MSNPLPKIWLSSPHMGENELEYVKNAFETNWIAPLGPHVDAFEKSIESFSGCGHAAALSSGTSALHLAMIMLGVSTGDEVLVSTFTFSATVNPIVYQQAKPVFVDSEKDTWNMCPKALEMAIKGRISQGNKPKAIVLVHLYGQPAKIDQIKSLADYYQIPLVEDAAESLGATFEGKMTGTFGDFGVYSFNGNKIITTSGGGTLVSKNEENIKKARFLATQARDPAPHYQHSQIGYNYRLSNVLAGIGRGQMEVLPERIAQRRKNFEFYQEHLGTIDGISFLPEWKGTFANRWLTCITIDPKKTNGKTREDLRLYLETLNIETRPLWKPMHLQPIFENYPHYGEKISEALFENGLCLPSGSNLTEEDLNRVVEGIKKVLA